jgi:tetratricopeptide (TPR) repeat protein
MSRSLIRFSLFVTVLMCAAATSMAQQIQGDVRYAENNQPAPRISIACDGTGGNLIQMTDDRGKFYFRVSPGHYTCYIHIPGYQTEQMSADLTDTNSNEYFPFKLKRDANAARASGPAAAIDASIPEAARKEFEKGESLIVSGKKDDLLEASKHYEKAVAVEPKFLQAQLRLGTTYMDLQQWDKAEAALHQAIQIDPKAANAHLALGDLYWQQKKGPEAEKALLEGLAIEDRSWQGHFSLARVYWDMAVKTKDQSQMMPILEKAYVEVRKTLELNPQHPGAHLLKGNLLMKGRRAADAVVEFDEYLRLEPKGAMSDQTRAYVEKIKKALAESGNKP